MLHQCHTDVTLTPLFVFHPHSSISLYLNTFPFLPSIPFVFSPLDLLMIYTPYVNHNGHTAYTATRFNHTSNKLSITEAYIHFHNKDSLLTPGTDCLKNVGIINLPEEFEIETLNRKKMILKSSHYQLEFRKF